MPIRTTCPECQAVYELADHLGGKRRPVRRMPLYDPGGAAAQRGDPRRR